MSPQKQYYRSDFFGDLSKSLQGMPKDLQAKWKRWKYNPWLFVSEACYTVTDADPPNGNFQEALMVLFDVQVDALKESITIDLENDTFYIEDSHWEKSRQMGASWMLMGAIVLWSLIFWPNISGMVMSRREDEVDDGGENATRDSLFGKVLFMYDRMPQWIKDRAPLEFKKLMIRNPINGSFCTGETANPDAGRGGTFKYVIHDEWAFVPNSEAVYSSTSRACPRGKVLNSTPNGTGNNYARIKKQETRGIKTGYKFVRMHWSQHPLYARGLHVDEKTGRLTSPWYEAQIATMTPEQIARELEISYTRSVSGLVYPEFNYEQHITTEAEYDPSKGPVYMGWDFGLNDPTYIMFMQKNELGGYDVFDEIMEHGAPIVEFVEPVREKGRHYGFAGGTHWGDPAGRQREKVTGSSVIGELAKHGIMVNSEQRSVIDGISIIRLMHRDGKIRVHPRCLVYIEAKTNYHYPLNRDGSVREGSEIPVHDWSSHPMDAERYVALGVFGGGEITGDDIIVGGGSGEWLDVEIEEDSGTVFDMDIDTMEIFGG